MKAISNDKRELIIIAKKRGDKEDEIALWLNASKSPVAKIWKLHKTKGSILPAKSPGRPSRLSVSEADRISREVDQVPDMTLNELIEKLALPIKKSQLSKVLIGLGYTFRKNASSKKPAKGRRPAKAGGLGQGPKGFREKKAGFP